MVKPRTLFWLTALIGSALLAWQWKRQQQQGTARIGASGVPLPPPPSSPGPGNELSPGQSTSSTVKSGPRRIATRVHRGAPHDMTTATATPAEATEATAPVDDQPAEQLIERMVGDANALTPAATDQEVAPESAAQAVETADATAAEAEAVVVEPQVTEEGTVLLNVNSATLEELITLPGINQVVAERIIAYREANGPVQAIGDLVDIKGISPKNLNAFAHLITV